MLKHSALHYQLQRIAHQLVKAAISRKQLSRKPCEECGSTFRIHAHHNDYNFPLEVRWLCATHHMAWHSNNSAYFARQKSVSLGTCAEIRRRKLEDI